ncbi:MAG: hypothetical protein A4E57_04623 [Syntrophorhabdaceae bacterium PtaU1.Bin034]|nr:MAG: hypothetical protein A4E57_04623 [Syntrophorhabdaceae bacterium PtaU1.Bin034]
MAFKPAVERIRIEPVKVNGTVFLEGLPDASEISFIMRKNLPKHPSDQFFPALL